MKIMNDKHDLMVDRERSLSTYIGVPNDIVHPPNDSSTDII